MRRMLFILALVGAVVIGASAQVRDLEPIEPCSAPAVLLGERADWLRGSWGINWKPTKLFGGRSETLSIDDFLHQIRGLKTLDYLQLHLGDSYIYSSVHLGPHDLLERLWQGDTDANGRPINLVVPRAAAGVDPFLEMLKATRAAGLKAMVYVNSSQLLQRDEDTPNPDSIPDITERWKAWCDTDPVAQAFIKSRPYHTRDGNPNRPYMFCYAEFVLKDYAIRYGDLVDAWLFDSGRFMERNGDDATNGVAADQRIYGAFADAVHAGNPLAAVAFNNGPGSGKVADGKNPFSPATRYDDYMFGHPFQGGKLIGDHTVNKKLGTSRYDRNYSTIQWIAATSGFVHAGDSNQSAWDWDDQVVGHYDPPMSTSAWNGGKTPALTDEEFKRWNRDALAGGGAISWGAPLINDEGTGEQLFIQDWAMAQLTAMDEYLSRTQSPGAPNWARALTPLPQAFFGEIYSHALVDGVDFWDPEGDAVTLSLVNAPDWLTLKKDAAEPGRWQLSGVPPETGGMAFQFKLRAEDASGATERSVTLKVGAPVSLYPFKGSVQVSATPNTTFGVDEVVTLCSGVQTAPDDLATFQVSFDVTPMAGGFIASGSSGQGWGLGGDAVFKGADGECVDSIGNLRITDFNANGGRLAVGDFSKLAFEFVEIVNGQSRKDRIVAVANGVTNAAGGVKMPDSPADLDLQLLGNIPITNVVLAVGNDSPACKWAVNSIGVTYEIQQ